ncbi:MAG: hypothetical protein ACLFS3_00865 [Candidatus Aenigmatarchaeota archaeon]
MFTKKGVSKGLYALLLAVLMLGVIGAAGSWTQSYFSDREMMTGNIIGAGEWSDSIACGDCGIVLAPYNNYTSLRTSNGTMYDVSYVVENDSPHTVKFEDAEPGLGEDGVRESDVFQVRVENCSETVFVKTKAGQLAGNVTLSGEGDMGTESSGLFTILLYEIESWDNCTCEYTFTVTSDSLEGQGSPALSHILFDFCLDDEIILEEENITDNQTEDGGENVTDNQTEYNQSGGNQTEENQTSSSGGGNSGGSIAEENSTQDDQTNETITDLRLSDSDEFHVNGVNATWTMENMVPGDRTTSSLTLSEAGTDRGDVIQLFFRNEELDPGCETGNNSDSDTLCGAEGMASYLEVMDMSYDSITFNLAPGTDFVDTNNNSWIDLDDLSRVDNEAALDNLTAPFSGVQTLTMQIKFNEMAGNDYQGDRVVTEVVAVLKNYDSQ